MSNNGTKSMSIVVNTMTFDKCDCQNGLNNNLEQTDANKLKSTCKCIQKCRNSQMCSNEPVIENEKKIRKSLQSECKIPINSVKDTRFHVIREVSSPYTKDIISISKIKKYTKRLLFMLEELRVELPPNHEHCDRVIGLINNVQWFLKDLDQCSGNSDQMSILLEKYDNYRKEFYKLRENINNSKVCKSFVNKKNAVVKSSINCDDEVEIIKSCSCNNLTDDNCNGRPVYHCPGILDITKLADDEPKKNCKKVTFKKKFMNWLCCLKNTCCFCFPCQISVFCSTS